MHETPEKTPLALEGRMRLALNRLMAATEPEDQTRVTLTFDVASPESQAFYAKIGITGEAFGIAATPEEAVDKAISNYSTAESRRAAALKKLQDDAEKLGLNLTPKLAVDPAMSFESKRLPDGTIEHSMPVDAPALAMN